MPDEGWQMPKWWYRSSRPISDNIYFENLCRIIFQTGLTWKVVEKKWPNIQQTFCHFNVDKVADFTEKDIDCLLGNKGVIRNTYKVHAIVKNAKKFRQITRQCGSFQSYLDSQDKSDNYRKIIKELANTFDRIGPTTAALFLYSVGENIKPTRFY